jgi:transposase
MKNQRRIYTREFKTEAVRLNTEKGIRVTQVSKDLGISPHLLCRWKRELQNNGEIAFRGKGHLKPEDEELRRLRRENELLRQERDILKKAAAFFAKETL